MWSAELYAQGPYYLRAHWDFTNAFTTAADISGNGHHGTVIGCTPVPGCMGLPNTALRFRPGNWVQVPGSMDFCHTEWTINVIARVLAFNPNTSTNQYSTVLSHEIRGGAKAYSIDVSDEPTAPGPPFNPLGQQMFASSGCATSVPTMGGPTIKLGCWYCFTAVNRPTLGGNIIDIYVDGMLVTSYPWPITGCTGSCGPLDLLIGKGDWAGFTTWFDGEIDDIQIYTNAMSQFDVQQYFTCPCGPSGNCGTLPGGNPCTSSIDDIDIVGALSTPLKRSYFVTTSPVSFGNIRWEVNGVLVATLSSTSTFTYTYPSSGYYTVCAFLFDPSTGFDCDTICFETCFTQDGLKPASQIKQTKTLQIPHFGDVFPNPASQSLTVPIKGYEGIISIEISDMNSKTMINQKRQVKITDPEPVVNIQSLPSGTYVIDIQAGPTASRQKFVKN